MFLRQIRKACGVPQRKAAADLGVSPTVLNRYENETRQPPLSFIVEAAKYYHTTTDAILGNEPVVDELDPKDSTLDDKLVNMLTSLPPEQVQLVMAFISGLRASQSLSDVPQLSESEPKP